MKLGSSENTLEVYILIKWKNLEEMDKSETHMTYQNSTKRL
jgi:hypothetical protein